VVVYLSHPDCGRHDTGWGHPEHVGRLRAIARALRSDVELATTLDQREGRHATREELALVHDPGYVAHISGVARPGELVRVEADTVVSEGSWDAATAAAGCLLDAVDLAVTDQSVRSFAAVRPPGHHALHDRAMGFCLFGNIALAARYARTRHAVDRVLIVDWDVHHGNGTQALVERDPGIHFVSLHQRPWYPGTGADDDRGPLRTIWNVPMPAGRPAAEYRDAVIRAVDDAAVGFTPQLILVSAGFDSLLGDPLGGFTLEIDDVALLTQELVTRASVWCGGRVISALEGGYAPDRLAQACMAHLRALQ
jgi:acetoin utilization deacetylase AcuC-like enzyme